MAPQQLLLFVSVWKCMCQQVFYLIEEWITHINFGICCLPAQVRSLSFCSEFLS